MAETTGGNVRTWTIEKRGSRFVAMAWSANIAAGPLDVRLFDDLATAQKAAELTVGRPLDWREARGDEVKHGVVSAADI